MNIFKAREYQRLLVKSCIDDGTPVRKHGIMFDGNSYYVIFQHGKEESEKFINGTTLMFKGLNKTKHTLINMCYGIFTHLAFHDGILEEIIIINIRDNEEDEKDLKSMFLSW